MKLICAWCGKVIEDGDEGDISHGACEECHKVVLAQIEALKAAKEKDKRGKDE